MYRSRKQINGGGGIHITKIIIVLETRLLITEKVHGLIIGISHFVGRYLLGTWKVNKKHFINKHTPSAECSPIQMNEWENYASEIL